MSTPNIQCVSGKCVASLSFFNKIGLSENASLSMLQSGQLLTMKNDFTLYTDASLTSIAYVVSQVNFKDQGKYSRDRNNTLVLHHLAKSMKVTISFISFELGTNSNCQNDSTSEDVLSIYSDNNTVPLFKCGDTNATPQPLVYNNPDFDSLRFQFLSDSNNHREYGGFLLQYLGMFSKYGCSITILGFFL